MKVTVTQNFVASGFDCPAIGSVVNVSEEFGRHLCDIGVGISHETRVDPAPEVLKKKPSPSSRAAPASRKRTAKKRKKSAKK